MGSVVQEAIPTGVPKASNYFVFNTRRPVFPDVRVREAISFLFDFEWVNHSYFFDLYQRTAGYFDGSELSSHGRAADAREQALLAPFADEVRSDVLQGNVVATSSPPAATAGCSKRCALDLLAAAGYGLRGTELFEPQTSGRPLAFEIMVTASRDEERIALLFSQSLKRAGIAARVRLRRCSAIRGQQALTISTWSVPLGPIAVAGQRAGVLLGRGRGRSAGTRNYMGVKRPAIDAMIAALLKAEPQENSSPRCARSTGS